MSCCADKSCQQKTHKHQETSWNPLCAKFFDNLTGKDGVKVRDAVEVGLKSVEYFRGCDFYRYVARTEKSLVTRHAELLRLAKITPEEAENIPEDKKAVVLTAWAQLIGQLLIREGFVLRAEHRPLVAKLDVNEPQDAEEKRAIELAQAALKKDSAKWPKRVGITRQNQTFDDSAFYVINYEKKSPLKGVLLGGIITCVLIACLFPIWPYKLKVAAWHLGVIVATLFKRVILQLILVIVRLILFAGLWFAGYDYWLFPNLFDEDAGVIDSFKPTQSFTKRNDDLLMIIVRIFCAILSMGLFYKLAETHTLSDVTGVGSRAFLDVLEWGTQKLANAPANTQDIKLRSLEDLTPEERAKIQWEACARHCEFADYAELEDFCFKDCQCMTDLWESKCWTRCDPGLKSKLLAARETCHEYENEETNQEQEQEQEGDEVEIEGEVEDDNDVESILDTAAKPDASSKHAGDAVPPSSQDAPIKQEL